MKKTLTCLFCCNLVAALIACGGKQPAADPLADTGRTQLTENLLHQLHLLGDSSVYMFGQHDAVCYGLGWRGDQDRSDVQSVCGDLPAILSFDLGHLELGDSVNLDGVPFSQIRSEAVKHFQRGGMVTMSWHLDNPLTGSNSWVADSVKDVESHTVEAILEGGQQHDKFLGWLDRVADFLCSLQTPDGIRVPVLFRPWHEHTGSWFWWGQDLCTAEQYKALWRMTADRLRQQGVVNALYAYSPNLTSDGSKEKFMERYPGDDIIDLIGYDHYCFAPAGDTAAVARFAAELDQYLGIMQDAAREHGKAFALTETGYESLPDTTWYTRALQPVLERHPVAYALVWRNADNKPGHFYAPYPGHASADDFISFYNSPSTLFLRDVKGLYQGNGEE